MFELECNRGIGNFTLKKEIHDERETKSPEIKNLLLKGQMKYIGDISGVLFLCSPM